MAVLVRAFIVATIAQVASADECCSPATGCQEYDPSAQQCCTQGMSTALCPASHGCCQSSSGLTTGGIQCYDPATSSCCEESHTSTVAVCQSGEVCDVSS